MMGVFFGILVYLITKEIIERYESQLFRQVQILSFPAIAFGLFGLVGEAGSWEKIAMADWISIGILLIGALLLRGLFPWGKRGLSILISVAISTYVLTLIGAEWIVICSLWLIGSAGLVYLLLKRKERQIIMIPGVVVVIFLIGITMDQFFQLEGIIIIVGISVVYLYVTRLITYLHAVYFHSITDRLTGLYNRSQFMAFAEDLIQGEHRVGMIFIDLDDFKLKNDTEGHAVGDRILIEVAHALQQEISERGIAGRLGGEELGVLVIDDDALAIAQVLCTLFPTISNITASIGVAYLRKGQTVADLIQKADEAMYEAKKQGKNRVHLSTI